MQRKRLGYLLLAAAAGLLTSGMSCNKTIVRPSGTPPPAPCQSRCLPYLPPIPPADAVLEQREWVVDAVWYYAECSTTHNACVEEIERRYLGE